MRFQEIKGLAWNENLLSDLGNSIDIRLDTFTENSNRCACVFVFYTTSKCTPDTYAHTFVYTHVGNT